MSDTLYSARFRGPSLIEQNKSQTVSLSIEASGSAASVTSATFYLYDTGGNAIVDAQAASVAGGTVSGTNTAQHPGGTSLPESARWSIPIRTLDLGTSP